jgi:hypothetical protein
MNNELLSSAIAQLPTDFIDLTLLENIELGLDNIVASIATISIKANGDNALVATIDSLLASVHSKIDGALHTFMSLGEIAKNLKAKGEVVLEELKKIWNLMVSILQALRPVEELVCKYYPELLPIFALINALPKVG